MKPEKLDKFMYALMKEAYRFDFSEFLETWEITQEEFKKIEDWFEYNHGIKL